MRSRIDTVRARDALLPRHEPYWHRVKKGCYVGFRKVSATSVGTWIARHRDESTGQRVVYSFGHLDEARPSDRFDTVFALAEAWFAERSAGGSNPLYTVAQACADYVEHLRGTGRTEAACDALGRFRRWVYSVHEFANTPLVKLTPDAVDHWRQHLARTPTPARRSAPPRVTSAPARSASALNRDMTSLRAALNLALENGQATSDLAGRTKLRPLANADGHRTNYLDQAQRRALIAQAPADLAHFVQGLALLPVRPGALAALVVADFDTRVSILTIGSDKAHGARRVALPDTTAEFFARQCAGKAPRAPLFGRADGSAWTKDTWKKPLKQAALAAGLPQETVAYDLRHSSITDLISLRRLDTLTVAQIAGTSPAMIEKSYGHLLLDHAKAALEGLALWPDPLGTARDSSSLGEGAAAAPR